MTLSVLPVLALGAVVSGCGREEAPDLVNGKQLFAERCGSCHVLERAGTAGRVGPDLDAAFVQSRRDGLGSDTIEGVIRDQIANPRRTSQMPPDLVTGDDARDVAAYLAAVAGVRGEDTGELAQVGPGAATSGREIFTSAGCNSCHTFEDAGSRSDVGPSLDALAGVAADKRPGMSGAEYVREAILRPGEFVVEGFRPGVMPETYGEQLTKRQVDALVRYLLRGR